jgi:hypothetical protein
MPENIYKNNTREYLNINGRQTTTNPVTITKYTHKSGSFPNTYTATPEAKANATDIA